MESKIPKKKEDSFFSVFINKLGYSWHSVQLYFITLYQFIRAPKIVVKSSIEQGKKFMHPASFIFASTLAAMVFSFLLGLVKPNIIESDSVTPYLKAIEKTYGKNPPESMKWEIDLTARRLGWIDQHAIGTKSGDILMFLFFIFMSICLIPILRLFYKSGTFKELTFYNGYLFSITILVCLLSQFLWNLFAFSADFGSEYLVIFGLTFIVFPIFMFLNYINNTPGFGIGKKILFTISYVFAWFCGSTILSILLDLYLSSNLYKV